ncbi:MAG: hypothetical protein JW384_01634 [Nitrosomonadaceae bacterium]|nr:hypothetical protein [Nitrosomonadaceae bacterium]
MPFPKDSGTRESDRYCSLCFKNNAFCYEGDNLKEFQKVMYASMRASGSNVLFAAIATWMTRFAPRWRK